MRFWTSKFIGAILATMLLCGSAFAGNYYVSKNGNNSGGTSWTTAWSEFDQINWGVIQPGDTIYIDGGAGGMTYSTKLITKANGTSSARVTIQRSTESGHDGTVTCQGQIMIYSKYTTLDGIDNTKFLIPAVDTMCVVFLGYDSANDATGSMLANVTLDQNFATESGISVGVYSDEVTVYGCKFIKSPGEDQLGIISTGNVLVDSCEFKGQMDSGTDVHRDVLSVYPGTAPGNMLTVRNCYIHDSETDSIIVIPNEGAALGSFDINNNTWWNVDTCIKFDGARIASMQGANIRDNKKGKYSVWLTTGGAPGDVAESNNIDISSAPAGASVTSGSVLAPVVSAPKGDGASSGNPDASVSSGTAVAKTAEPAQGSADLTETQTADAPAAQLAAAPAEQRATALDAPVKVLSPHSGATTSSASAQVPGLVAALGFDESSSNTVRDLSGNGNNGTLTGTVRTRLSRFGKALSFNGENEWITVNDSPSLHLSNGATIEAWVYPMAELQGWRMIVAKETADNSAYYLAANSQKNQPAAGGFIGGEKILYGGAQLPVKEWSHIAMTYDGATQSMYVNGVLVGSQPLNGPLAESKDPLRIGGNSIWGEYFNGIIDEVRIYNRALTSQEIQTDMRAPISLLAPAAKPAPKGVLLAGASVGGAKPVQQDDVSVTTAR